MKKYLVVVKGDENDGNYVHNIQEMTYEEFYKPREGLENYSLSSLFYQVSFAIKKYNSENKWKHNWPINEKSDEEIAGMLGLSENQVTCFNEFFVPHYEYGIHSIKSMKIYEINNNNELL